MDPGNKLSSNFLYHEHMNSLNKTTLLFRKTLKYEFTKPCRCRYVRKDVDALDKKYKGDVRQYCFFQALLKVYFNELNELKGVRDAEKNS